MLQSRWDKNELWQRAKESFRNLIWWEELKIFNIYPSCSEFAVRFCSWERSSESIQELYFSGPCSPLKVWYLWYIQELSPQNRLLPYLWAQPGWDFWMRNTTTFCLLKNFLPSGTLSSRKRETALTRTQGTIWQIIDFFKKVYFNEG